MGPQSSYLVWSDGLVDFWNRYLENRALRDGVCVCVCRLRPDIRAKNLKMEHWRSGGATAELANAEAFKFCGGWPSKLSRRQEAPGPNIGHPWDPWGWGAAEFDTKGTVFDRPGTPRIHADTERKLPATMDSVRTWAAQNF